MCLRRLQQDAGVLLPHSVLLNETGLITEQEIQLFLTSLAGQCSLDLPVPTTTTDVIVMSSHDWHFMGMLGVQTQVLTFAEHCQLASHLGIHRTSELTTTVLFSVLFCSVQK